LDPPALDAGLIWSAHAVEHYEIARYGTQKSRVALFEANLQEELATDQKLRELCGMSASPKGAICKLARFGGLSS
jgi:ferritin-like metal-binding protein YciE